MKRPAAIAFLAIALVAAGCGSSGNGRLSDAAFTSKANAICTAANTANASINRTKTGLAALKAEEALITSTIKQLEALKAPSNRSGAFQAYVSDVKHIDSVLLQLEAAAAAGDAAKIKSIEAGVARFETTGKNAAKAAGIDTCD